MEKKKEFKLIDGVFTASDAGTLLSALIDEKVRYHQLDDFSNHIRNDRDSQHSQQRIAELIQTKAALKAWLDLASQNGLPLVVESTVTIQFDENFPQT